MSSEAAAYLSGTLSDVTETGMLAPATPSRPGLTTESHATTTPNVSALQDQSDENLLFLVSNQNREALSILFRRHAPQVFRVARRILNDDAEAEDLLQEFFIFLFQRAGIFDVRKSSAKSWIIQMVYHRAVDRRRHLHSRQHYNSNELDEERKYADWGQISIDDLAGRQLLGKLREELSEEQRQTLELHFFEGYTFHEIAEKTGQGFGNVRHHYYRGLERLRSLVFPGKTRSK